MCALDCSTLYQRDRFKSQRKGRKETYKNQYSSKLKDTLQNQTPVMIKPYIKGLVYNNNGFRCQQSLDLRFSEHDSKAYIGVYMGSTQIRRYSI